MRDVIHVEHFTDRESTKGRGAHGWAIREGRYRKEMSERARDDFDYASVEHDVRTRAALPATIRAEIADLPRERWGTTPGYAGFPEHFLAVHEQLRGVSGGLVKRLESVADAAPSERDALWRAARVTDVARALTDFAHHHHDLEEANLFPWLARARPEFERAMRLLDGDHRVLEETLARVEASTVRDARGAPRGHDDRALGEALRAASDLSALLARHLADEEEIAVPALLGVR